MTHLVRTARRLSVASLGAAVLVAAGGSVAAAATLGGSRRDPRDSSAGAQRDIEALHSTYDGSAGVWRIAVQFYAPLSSAEKALFYIGLQVRAADGRCGGRTIAQFESNTDPRHVGSPVGDYTGGPPGDDSKSAKSISEDRRVMTLSLSDPRLVDQPVCAVGFGRLSWHNDIFDTTDRFLLTEASR